MLVEAVYQKLFCPTHQLLSEFDTALCLNAVSVVYYFSEEFISIYPKTEILILIVNTFNLSIYNGHSLGICIFSPFIMFIRFTDKLFGYTAEWYGTP